MLTAHTFLEPHFIGLDIGKKAPLLNVLHPTKDIPERDSEPTVENMYFLIQDAIKYKSEDSDSFEKDIWAPTKPIAHLAYATASMLAIETFIKAEGGDMADRFLDNFFNETLLACIAMAENCRTKLPSIKQFKIREEDTIQFIAV
jgi:hypothetical protein